MDRVLKRETASVSKSPLMRRRQGKLDARQEHGPHRSNGFKAKRAIDPDEGSLSPTSAAHIRQRALKKRRQLCRFFVQGKCMNGLYCQWAHGTEELEVTNPDDDRLWKTKLCTHFINGWCAQDTMCPFAHGDDELRRASRGRRQNEEGVWKEDCLQPDERHSSPSYSRSDPGRQQRGNCTSGSTPARSQSNPPSLGASCFGLGRSSGGAGQGCGGSTGPPGLLRSQGERKCVGNIRRVLAPTKPGVGHGALGAPPFRGANGGLGALRATSGEPGGGSGPRSAAPAPSAPEGATRVAGTEAPAEWCVKVESLADSGFNEDGVEAGCIENSPASPASPSSLPISMSAPVRGSCSSTPLPAANPAGAGWGLSSVDLGSASRLLGTASSAGADAFALMPFGNRSEGEVVPQVSVLVAPVAQPPADPAAAVATESSGTIPNGTSATPDPNAAATCATTPAAVAVETPMLVANCSNGGISQEVHGVYQPFGTNQGRPAFRRISGTLGATLTAYIYFWDEPGGPDFSGWWIGSTLGGGDMWAHHPSQTAMMPPESGWHAPPDGPLDRSMSVRPLAAESAVGVAADAGTVPTPRALGLPDAGPGAGGASGETVSGQWQDAVASGALADRPANGSTQATTSPSGPGGASGETVSGQRQDAVASGAMADRPANGSTQATTSPSGPPSGKQTATREKASIKKTFEELRELERRLTRVREDGQTQIRQLLALQEQMDQRRQEEDQILSRMRQLIASVGSHAGTHDDPRHQPSLTPLEVVPRP